MLSLFHLSIIKKEQPILYSDVWNSDLHVEIEEIPLHEKLYLIVSDLLLKIGIIGKVNSLSSKVLPSTGKAILEKFHLLLSNSPEPDNKTLVTFINDIIGIATIYRTLNFLEEVKLISSISFGKDGKKYESNSKDQHHDHLICTSCGKIIEFFDETIEKRQEEIAIKNGFQITDHTMQIYGLCELCQTK